MISRNNICYDVTIAGAGPSGAILAYELAKKGVKVLLLEKHLLPRDKVCAGGVTVRSASILPFDFSHLIENTIYGVRLSFKLNPKKIRTYSQPLTYMVSRNKFDYLLTSKAAQAGAVIEEEVEVQNIQVNPDHVFVKTNRNSFTTPILIGADGANSAIVRSLGLKTGFEYGLGVNGYVNVGQDLYSKWNGLMGLDYGLPGGYAWVFPKSGCLSIGAGGSYRIAKTLRPYTIRLARKFGFGHIDERTILGHLMPIRRPGTPLSFKRVLLVGDAAGVIDALTGEGIYYGLRSSYIALPVIMSFLEGKITNLKTYDERINQELGPELKAARTLQKLNSLTPRIFFHYLQESDRFWRALCHVLRGERTYVSCVNRLPLPLRAAFRICEL